MIIASSHKICIYQKIKSRLSVTQDIQQLIDECTFRQQHKVLNTLKKCPLK